MPFAGNEHCIDKNLVRGLLESIWSETLFSCYEYYHILNNRHVMNPYSRYIFKTLLFLFRALFMCHPMQVAGMLHLLPRTFPSCSRNIRDGSFSFCNFLRSEIFLFTRPL